MAKKIVEPNTIKLAACGINCEACYLHLRQNNPCLGCWEPNRSKAERCQNCKIMDCLMTKAIRFCFKCPTFPCDLIEQLDQEYRHKFENASSSQTGNPLILEGGKAHERRSILLEKKR